MTQSLSVHTVASYQSRMFFHSSGKKRGSSTTGQPSLSVTCTGMRALLFPCNAY